MSADPYRNNWPPLGTPMKPPSTFWLRVGIYLCFAGLVACVADIACTPTPPDSAIEADTTRFEECANLYAAANTIEELRAAQAKCHVATDGGAP